MDLSGMRILAVDDQANNLLLIRQALKQIGYKNLVTETDPHQAALRIHAEEFDLILLDFNMPTLNGLALLSNIFDKVNGERIPVVMLTAQSDRDTRHAALTAGAKEFISKPIDLTELKLRVNNLLENRYFHIRQVYQNRLLEEKVVQRTAALENLQIELIRRLANAAEHRDNDTGAHVQRMSLYAECIGRKMRLPESQLSLLLNASPMHDIGKIGIDDHILRKPGKYTAEEFAVMQQHTRIGAKILAHSSFNLIQAAYDIALCHHEHWDGSGYPHGLAKEQIPLLARIVSVADVFDALTMIRPYKKAWSNEAAYNEILALSGSFFDPAVVAAFQAGFEEILQISASLADQEDKP